MHDSRDRDLRGSRFEQVDLRGAWFRGVDLTGAVLRGAELVDVEISGEIRNLRINGIDVGPLVTAELDRRHPDHAKMRPRDAADFREAWAIVEAQWKETVERARRLPPGQLHASVDGEWSFIETLRHLVFVTDAWIRRTVLGEAAPWHPFDLPWDEAPDDANLPRDRTVRPSLDQMLELRRDRTTAVRRLLATMSDARLERHTEPVRVPGWPASGRYVISECLQCVLNEEWWHRRFAERDLAALEAAPRRNAAARPGEVA